MCIILSYPSFFNMFRVFLKKNKRRKVIFTFLIMQGYFDV